MAVRAITAAFLAAGLLALSGGFAAADAPPPAAPAMQTPDAAAAKTAGCMSCHTQTDSLTMHTSPGVNLGCTDCHGGDGGVMRASVVAEGSEDYRQLEERAHVQPRYPDDWHWPSSAKPEESYTLLNRENPAFIRFENPSDYRVAREACGACHLGIIQAAERSLMATAAHFWGAASYNNGIVPFKHSVLGEAYTEDGQPASEVAPVKPTPQMTHDHGIIAQIYPLPAWEDYPPADVFRVFERGGRNINSTFPEIGLPDSNGELAAHRGAGPARHPPVEPRPRHRAARLDPGPQHHQDAAQRSLHLVHGHERQPGRLSQFRLRLVPRRLCQQPRRRGVGALCQVRQPRHERDRSIRPSRTANRRIRSAT